MNKDYIFIKIGGINHSHGHAIRWGVCGLLPSVSPLGYLLAFVPQYFPSLMWARGWWDLSALIQK